MDFLIANAEPLLALLFAAITGPLIVIFGLPPLIRWDKKRIAKKKAKKIHN